MRYSSTVGLSDTSFFLQSRKCLKGCHNKNLSLTSRDYIQHNILLSNVLEISRLGSEVFQTSCFKIWKSCSQHKQTTFCSWAEQREICPCSQKLFVTKYWLDHIRTTFIFISVLLIIIPFKLIPSFTFMRDHTVESAG